MSLCSILTWVQYLWKPRDVADQRKRLQNHNWQTSDGGNNLHIQRCTFGCLALLARLSQEHNVQLLWNITHCVLPSFHDNQNNETKWNYIKSYDIKVQFCHSDRWINKTLNKNFPLQSIKNWLLMWCCIGSQDDYYGHYIMWGMLTSGAEFLHGHNLVWKNSNSMYSLLKEWTKLKTINQKCRQGWYIHRLRWGMWMISRGLFGNVLARRTSCWITDPCVSLSESVWFDILREPPQYQHAV